MKTIKIWQTFATFIYITFLKHLVILKIVNKTEEIEGNCNLTISVTYIRTQMKLRINEVH